MNTIIIIGTEPPCPRCGILQKVFKEKVKEYSTDAQVLHFSHTAQEAKKIAHVYGLKNYSLDFTLHFIHH